MNTISNNSAVVPATGSITADEINAAALELSELGNSLITTGSDMLRKALELGGLLCAKKAEIDKQAPGTWQAWAIENLTWDPRHERRYRKLYTERTRVSAALEAGEISSIRQALALLQDVEDGGEQKARPIATTRTAGIYARLWKVFAEPARVPEPERKEFCEHTAAAVRLCKEQGWELPAVGPTIDIEMEEVA